MARKNPQVGKHPDMFGVRMPYSDHTEMDTPVVVPWRDLTHEELLAIPYHLFTTKELVEIEAEDPDAWSYIVSARPTKAAQTSPLFPKCDICEKALEPGAELTKVFDVEDSPEETHKWCDDCFDSGAIKCDHYGCGRFVATDVSVTVNDDEEWCPYCVDAHATTCNDCDTRVNSDSISSLRMYQRNAQDRKVCESCSSDYSQCARCDKYVETGSSGDSMTDVDGDEWCPRCYENYGSYCENCDTTYSTDSGCSCIEGGSGVIKDYHSHKGQARPIKTPWTSRQTKPFYFGVELEVEAPDTDDDEREELAKRVADDMGDLLLGIEEDGSLDHGFEIITQPAGLDMHTARWSKVDFKGLKSHDTNTCGLHIHVTRASIAKLTLGKLLIFVNHEENREFFETFARRQFSSRFARRIPGTKLTEGTKQRPERYEAINLSNLKTVEFRFFKGSTKVLTILASLELVYAMIRFCETVSTPKEDSLGGLTIVKFLDFVASDNMANETQHLRTYLVERQLNDLPGMKKKILAPLPRKQKPRTRFNG